MGLDAWTQGGESSNTTNGTIPAKGKGMRARQHAGGCAHQPAHAPREHRGQPQRGHQHGGSYARQQRERRGERVGPGRERRGALQRRRDVVLRQGARAAVSPLAGTSLRHAVTHVPMTCMMWTDPSTGGVASSNRPLGMNDGDLSVTTRVVLIGLLQNRPAVWLHANALHGCHTAWQARHARRSRQAPRARTSAFWTCSALRCSVA